MVDRKAPANNLVTDLRTLMTTRSTKVVSFMGAKIEIHKLTLAECMEVQKLAKDVNEENAEAGFSLLKQVIRIGVPAAETFTDQEFEGFPMDELNKLSSEVLKYSGMDNSGK